jgi:hypothetical protein
MNFKFTALAVAALSCGALHAQDPNPQAILEGARVSATLVSLDEGLSGSLSKGGQKTPIELFLKGKDIQFQFKQASDWRVFHMRLAENSYDLFEITDGKTTKFPDAKVVESIAGTDLTYEDLSFRFFYWPNPKLEGTEDINHQPCYKLRVDKPKGAAGRYDTIYIWVHQQYGAFMQIKGYSNGKLLKEFQVEDVMQVSKGVWSLKKMQVSTNDPATERRVSITDVVFETPKKAGPKGLGH